MKYKKPEAKEQSKKTGSKKTSESRDKFLRDWKIKPQTRGTYGALYPGSGEYAPSKVIAGKPFA